MGIPGLTTYVNSNTGIFYKDHALHDTLLLVDGNSLVCQIYLELTVTNSAFGGDYERYKHSVEKFMKLLLSCNVLPIVVFDGGYETRKLRTTVSRLKNTIYGVSSFKSINQQNNVKLFPMFMKEVFKHVTRTLHIPCVQSDLEADFDLVYLSRKFQCPILSYDSDFYINDVEYIPFFNIRLKGGRECSQSSTGKALYCKIYRVENLFKHFGGLSKEFIPLLQCMLGNDYISHMHFKYFLSQLNFRFTSGQKSPVSKRLAVLVKWCRAQRSLETALNKIIENLKFHRKTEAIKQVKRSIRDYKMEECILYPYVMEQIDKYNLRKKVEEFMECTEEKNEVEKREEAVSNEISEAEEDMDLDKSNSDVEEEEEGDDESKEGNNSDDMESDRDCTYDINNSDKEEEDESSSQDESCVDTTTSDSTPKVKQFNNDYLRMEWLVDAFRHGKLSTHIANMINLGNIYLLPLRENIKLPSVHTASYPLLSTMAKLLLNEGSKCRDRQVVLRVYTREMGRMKVIRLKDEVEQTEECNIVDIVRYDLDHRRRLLLKYLNLDIDENLLNGEAFPQDWNLFVLGLLYWCNISSHVNSYHIKCLVVCFIFLNIVQTKCGYFETMGNFNKKYAKKLNEFKTNIQNDKIQKKKSKKSGKKNVASNGSEKENTNVMNKGEGLPDNLSVTNTNKQSEPVAIDKNDSNPKSIHEILNNLTDLKESLFLYEQFLHLSHLDEKLRSNHTCFNKDVIHVLSEYQSLFYVVNMVNSILNFPFNELDMSCIYSGTFLYNLYTKVYNKDNSIKLLFENCDNMLSVYNFIVNFLEKNTNSDVFKSNSIRTKRKKKKKAKSNREESEDEEIDEIRDPSDEEGIIDSDNIYSILQNVHM